MNCVTTNIIKQNHKGGVIPVFKSLVYRFIKEEDGQGLIEYAILGALLVVVLIVTIKALSGAIGNKFKRITDELNNAN